MAVEIESITGQVATDQAGPVTWFMVTYSDGEEERRQGSLMDARALAVTAGLQLVHAPAGTFRWARDPQTHRIPGTDRPSGAL